MSDGVKDGIPYTKEYVNRWGQLNVRENQNLPPIVFELEKKYGCRLWNHGFVMTGTKGALSACNAQRDLTHGGVGVRFKF